MIMVIVSGRQANEDRIIKRKVHANIKIGYAVSFTDLIELIKIFSISTDGKNIN